MPRFAPFLNKIHQKLEEAKISDLNHELGKLAQGSAAYWGHFRSDASSVGSFLKSGSSRLWPSSQCKEANVAGGLPKSVSLPSGFSGVVRRHHPDSKGDLQVKARHSKYQYRSSTLFEDQDDDAIAVLPGTAESTPESSIRVIENLQDDLALRDGALSLGKLDSREEIRKKLAFGPDLQLTNKGPNTQGRKSGGDLEVCFINESVFEEEAVSKEAILSPIQLLSSVSLEDFEVKAAEALSHCRLAACRKLEADKRRREYQDRQTLVSLIGRDISVPLSQESLSKLNLAALQVIVNHYHNRVETLNESLVRLLLEKDELQIEQDGQMLDIEDLSQSQFKKLKKAQLF